MTNEIRLCPFCGALPCDRNETPDRQELRDMIVEIAADLAEAEPFWTAGMLADALIEKVFEYDQ